MLGNPFTSLEEDGIGATLHMLKNHAVISPESVADLVVACAESIYSADCNTTITSIMDKDMYKLNPCNIYDKCMGLPGNLTMTTNLGCSNFYKDPTMGCIDYSSLHDFVNVHWN